VADATDPPSCGHSPSSFGLTCRNLVGDKPYGDNDQNRFYGVVIDDIGAGILVYEIVEVNECQSVIPGGTPLL
jgi:hypothetical protein